MKVINPALLRTIAIVIALTVTIIHHNIVHVPLWLTALLFAIAFACLLASSYFEKKNKLP